MERRFVPGAVVEHAGGRWRVQRPLGADAVLLRNDDGEVVAADPVRVTFPDEDTPLCGPLPRPVDELRYTEAEWAEAERRRDLLDSLARRAARTGIDVAAVAAALGVTPRRVWALLRRVRAHGGADTAALFLPARPASCPGRLSAEVEAVIAHAIDQHYAKPTRPSLHSLSEEVVNRCTAAGLVPPSYKAVQARVRARDQVWLKRRREGEKAARSIRLLTGAHPGADAPWARVQIDSTPCDVRVVREHERTVIGRPTVTLALDLYSRVILGFSLALDAASTVTVATCLAHACLPKQDWLAARDLAASVRWPVWGKPAMLEYDQGPENEAYGIQRGLRLHGIKGRVRAKGHPEQHGHIERLIGTMMKRLHERRGTTFSNVNERGEADPAATACLTLPELERIFALEIDRYNHTVHHGISERPMERYLAYYRRPDLPDAQRVPPFLPAEHLLQDFLPHERRHLVRTGFRLFRVDYSSRDLLPMWRRQNQAKVERIVVYDPRSLARVWVMEDAADGYVAVPYRTPHPDMTLAESVAARRALRALKAADRTEARLFENVLSVRAIEERGRTATARMRAERSRQARHTAVLPPSGPAAPTDRDTERDRAPMMAAAPFTAPPLAVITAFDDVEDL